MVKNTAAAHPRRMRLLLAAIAILLAAAAMAISPCTAYAAGIPSGKIHTVADWPDKRVDNSKVEILLFKSRLNDFNRMKDGRPTSTSGDVSWETWTNDEGKKQRRFRISKGGQSGSFSFIIQRGGRYVWSDEWVDVKLTCHVELKEAVPAASSDFPGYVDCYNFNDQTMGYAHSGWSSQKQQQKWTVRLYKAGTAGTDHEEEITKKNFAPYFSDLDIPDQVSGEDSFNTIWSEGIELVSKYTAEIWRGKAQKIGAPDFHTDDHGKPTPGQELTVGTNDDHPWIHASHRCKGGTGSEKFYDSSFATLAESGFTFIWRGRDCETKLGLFGWPDPDLDPGKVNIKKTPEYQECAVGGLAEFCLEFRLPHVASTNTFKEVFLSDPLNVCFNAGAWVDLSQDNYYCRMVKVDANGNEYPVGINWKPPSRSGNTVTMSAISMREHYDEDVDDDLGATGLHRLYIKVPLKADFDYSTLPDRTTRSGMTGKLAKNSFSLTVKHPDIESDDHRKKLTSDDVDIVIPMYADVDLLCTKVDADAVRAGDADAGAQGNASLAGALFSVMYYPDQDLSHDGEPGYTASATFASDISGKVRFGSATPVSGTWPWRENGKNVMPLGTCVCVETSAPDGYATAERHFKLKVSAGVGGVTVTRYDQDGTTVIENESGPVEEPVWRGDMHFTKGDVDFIRMIDSPEPGYEENTGARRNDPEGGATLAGAVYQITNASPGYVYVDGKRYGPGEVIDNTYLVTDEDGFACTTGKRLPYGSYILKEKEPPPGYLLSDDEFRFTIGQDGEDVKVGRI